MSRKKLIAGMGTCFLALSLTACGGAEVQTKDYSEVSLQVVIDDLNKQVEGTGDSVIKPKDLLEERPITTPADWKVCSQSVKSGVSLDTEKEIEVGVVKVSEECPPLNSYTSEGGKEVENVDPNSTTNSSPSASATPDSPVKSLEEQGKEIPFPEVYQETAVDAAKRLSSNGLAGQVFFGDFSTKQLIQEEDLDKSWVVCETSPKAGEKIREKAFRAILLVAEKC